MVRIALDGMGGDNAPVEIVKGAVDAVNIYENVSIVILGDEHQIAEELGLHDYPKDRIRITSSVSSSV